jgi:hypothetical protein
VVGWLFIATVILSAVVTALVVILPLFFLMQMRESDRLQVKELREFMIQNRAEIAELKVQLGQPPQGESTIRGDRPS